MLVSELQALVAESKRRHPEVKEASEKALAILNGNTPRDELSRHCTELLNPITLGCKTKVAKIIGISISALQRLVALKGVPTTLLPDVLQTLGTVANQAVEIQLKLLQVLLSILTYNQDVHDDILGSALLLCFKLQESRVSVVSSTAAATLRQAVMLVFDRLTVSHKAGVSIEPPVASEVPTGHVVTLPGDEPAEIAVSASQMDAYHILADLCLLTASTSTGLWGGSADKERDKPTILKLGSLQRTFGLELIESILSGYEESVKQRPELLYLLQHSLTPLLLKLQAERPSFPVALRVCRLIFLLVRAFSEHLSTEVETFFVLLLKIGTGEVELEEGGKKDAAMPYMRVLALESLRGGDAFLLQRLYERYDAYDRTHLFTRLVEALSKLLHEKPALLGVCIQLQGLGIATDTKHNSAPDAGYFDVGIGFVSAAASAGVHTVGSMMGQERAGLSASSGMRQKLIEQHDKADTPLIPDTYPYLLALQSLNAIADGLYTTHTHPSSSISTIKAMADSAWPALLTALSKAIATNLGEGLFNDVVSAFVNFTILCGNLGLNAPRDAFLATLGKYAVPPAVVSAMQTYSDPTTSRSASATGAEALGLVSLTSAIPTGPPALSDRNLACLRSVISIAQTLSSSLCKSWHDVLEVLQNANFMLSRRQPAGGPRRPTIASPLIGTPALRSSIDAGLAGSRDVDTENDPDAIQASIDALFQNTREMPDEAFSEFVDALCRLSFEMIGGQLAEADELSTVHDGMPNSPRSPSTLFSPGGRRTSGLQVSHSNKVGGSFSLTKLRLVATLNLSRLIAGAAENGWDAITQHLLSVARHTTAPSSIRMQACETVGEILLAAMRIGREARLQHQVFDVLLRQVNVQPVSQTVSVDYDVRSAGYNTLEQILESNGHSLEVGWETIFEMLNWVCSRKPNSTHKRKGSEMMLTRSESSASLNSLSRASGYSKSRANLVRIAFPSLNLICTDFLSSLDGQAMQQCISSLGYFGRQHEDVNIALSSIGLLWNVSDAVQRNETGKHDLWLFLLEALLDLAQDERLEVRTGAMQTLFRCIDLHGASLDSEMWMQVLDSVIFPLIESVESDESQVLALTSVGGIFGMFLKDLAQLKDFEAIWKRFLRRIEKSFKVEPRACVTAALRALDRVLGSLTTSAPVEHMLESTWATFVDIGKIEGDPYTQDNLVALVAIASRLHDSRLQWTDDMRRTFSDILVSMMSYSQSPDYRHDVDSMSPLQQNIVNLIEKSDKLGSAILLADLAEFASLAYVGEGGENGKRTYIALSKYSMSVLAETFQQHAMEAELYKRGTVESILGAYAIPIKLKYDCPPPSKFGDDRPLWQTALVNGVLVIENVIHHLPLVEAREEAIWSVIMDILTGTLLAETDDSIEPAKLEEDEAFVMPLLGRLEAAIMPRIGDDAVPERIRTRLAELLRKASVLYHTDGLAEGGTLAPAIPAVDEQLRMWALNWLISCAGADDGRHKTAKAVQRACSPILLDRFRSVLQRFLDDGKLRGHMPFPRIQEEELLFVLRTLVTIRISGTWLTPPPSASPLVSAAYQSSDRAHLLSLYPLLLSVSCVSMCPNMWLLPSEHRQLFDPESISVNGASDVHDVDEVAASAGDGDNLIQISGKDLARRALELVGQELGLG